MPLPEKTLYLCTSHLPNLLVGAWCTATKTNQKMPIKKILIACLIVSAQLTAFAQVPIITSTQIDSVVELTLKTLMCQALPSLL